MCFIIQQMPHWISFFFFYPYKVLHFNAWHKHQQPHASYTFQYMNTTSRDLVLIFMWHSYEGPCGIVARVPGYRYKGPCSIPVALSARVGTNFANKGRSLGRYISLADSAHGVCLLLLLLSSFLLLTSLLLLTLLLIL
jgi:hypothetical protein